MAKWGNVTNRSIQNIIDGLRSGLINPNIKTYVFKLKDGRTIGWNAENEDQARFVMESKDYVIDELIEIETQSYHGMSIDEIKIEARNRGII